MSISLWFVCYFHCHCHWDNHYDFDVDVAAKIQSIYRRWTFRHDYYCPLYGNLMNKMVMISFFSFYVCRSLTLLPKIKTNNSVTVNCVWQKNMMYNKSGFAGDCKNSLFCCLLCLLLCPFCVKHYAENHSPDMPLGRNESHKTFQGCVKVTWHFRCGKNSEKQKKEKKKTQKKKEMGRKKGTDFIFLIKLKIFIIPWCLRHLVWYMEQWNKDTL